jgi:hypothetical protein
MTGACVTIPSIIDFMSVMKNELGIDEHATNDISSGINYFKKAIYNLSINIGEALGPLIGGGITNFFSFDQACKFTSILCLIYSSFFLIFNYNKIKKDYSAESALEASDTEEDWRLTKLLESQTRRQSYDRYSYVSRQRAFSLNTKSRKDSSCYNNLL